MPSDSKIGIFEMGMSSAGDIRKLVNLIPPSVSLITSISEAHLEFFDSPFDIAKAKSEILESASRQDATIIPHNSPYADFLKSKACVHGIKNIVFFGNGSSAHIASCNFDEENTAHVQANILGENISYRLKNANDGVVENSLAAIISAHTISGGDPQNLADALDSFSAPSKRGEVIFLKKHDIMLIDDTYNACPLSMRTAIRSMAVHHGRGRRKIAVLGDMQELGPNSFYHHANLSATLDKYGVDLLFACGELSKYLYDNTRGQKRGAWCENVKQLADCVLKEIHDGDCVLVKGSRSMNMETIIEAVKNNKSLSKQGNSE
jgi:UDP-N-acetylmuramoyl-tripeptide--D-alanyl-D-alanine ligase